MSIERIRHLPPLPSRPANAHKGTFGRVLIVAGSRGMSGAAALAGLGALRGGTGLVYLGVPSGILPIVASIEPSYLTIPLSEDDEGRLAAIAYGELVDLISSMSAVAVGPGWGQSEDLADLLRRLYAETACPLVADADALNLLAATPDILTSETSHRSVDGRVLTPHPGEFARLLGTDIDRVQKHREELAVRFANDQGVILLLKGRRTVITDGKRLAVNETGNSGMATGGAGDVLTGLIAALLARGMPGFEAAQLAAHLHGLAGDLAAEELSESGLIASDLPRYLAAAWKQLALADPPSAAGPRHS